MSQLQIKGRLVRRWLSPCHGYRLMLTCSHTDSEGWFFGTSHNTGTSGLYPGNYVEKSKDSDCWTLHRWVGSAQEGGVCTGGGVYCGV